jgi:hypothetical protein
MLELFITLIQKRVFEGSATGFAEMGYGGSVTSTGKVKPMREIGVLPMDESTLP